MKPKDEPVKSDWKSFAIIALALAFLAAIGLNFFECQIGTTDQCSMSKGFFPFYWGGMFLILWPMVALLGGLARTRREKNRDI
jgi:hypothetical protein